MFTFRSFGNSEYENVRVRFRGNNNGLPPNYIRVIFMVVVFCLLLIKKSAGRKKKPIKLEAENNDNKIL